MSKRELSAIIILCICLVVLAQTLALGESDTPPYLNPTLPIDKRVEDLLGRMTLEEKIGQLNIPWVFGMGTDHQARLNAARQFARGTLVEEVGPAGGFFALPAVIQEGTKQQAEFANELQRIAIEETRLRIPLIIVEEGTHGLRATGGTVFPEGLALGSTWNMDLIERVYAAVAREARATGVHFLCTLVIEPNRDPRLGRNEEGYSEDPYLCSRIAKAIVAGTQGNAVWAEDKAGAMLCHFPGQSEPAGGLERGAMEISERILREVFLPPWVAGIKEAGALGVMATYPAIDAVPAHASYKFLTQILREELDFRGVLVSEGSGLRTLQYEGLVATQKEAGRLAINAGLDVSIWFEPGYLGPMLENVREGKVALRTIDRSVRRVLETKLRLGLFERPHVDIRRAAKVVHSADHQDLALEASREGIVLLKNDADLLPLDKNIQTIAVIGPNADQGRNQLGDYIARTISQDIVTVLDGIKKKVAPHTKVTYVKGCGVLKKDPNQISQAQDAAKNADVAIVVVGESGRTNGRASM